MKSEPLTLGPGDSILNTVYGFNIQKKDPASEDRILSISEFYICLNFV